MYKASSIDPGILSELPVIASDSGNGYQYPLDYRSVYHQIKLRSNNFTIEEPLAMKADQMLSELLVKYNIASKSESEEFLFKEKERQRQLALLRIKLNLKLK